MILMLIFTIYLIVCENMKFTEFFNIDIDDISVVVIHFSKQLNVDNSEYNNVYKYNIFTSNYNEIDLTHFIKCDVDIVIEFELYSINSSKYYKNDNGKFLEISKIGTHISFVCDNITDKNVDLFNIIGEI